MCKLFQTILLSGALLARAAYYHRDDGSAGQPRVQLGHTSLTGTLLQPSNLEFFGG